MQLPAAAPLHRDQVRGLQHGEVLGDALGGQVEVLAELAEGLAVVGVQAIEEQSPTCTRAR